MRCVPVGQQFRKRNMIRLLYMSQMTPGTTDAQVRDILDSAKRNNRGMGITGVLVHGGGLFMQILEGPEHTVLRTYVKILDDRRHKDCQILQISPAEERLFPAWSMGVIERDPLAFEHINELREHRMEIIQAQHFTDAMNLFVQMLKSG